MDNWIVTYLNPYGSPRLSSFEIVAADVQSVINDSMMRNIVMTQIISITLKAPIITG